MILTRNEGQHISACIKTILPWTDGVVVWDSGSTDATCNLADLAARLWCSARSTIMPASARLFGTVASEWILFVDADKTSNWPPRCSG